MYTKAETQLQAGRSGRRNQPVESQLELFSIRPTKLLALALCGQGCLIPHLTDHLRRDILFQEFFDHSGLIPTDLIQHLNFARPKQLDSE